CFFAFDETASRSSMLEDSPLEAEVVSTVREPEPLAFGPHAADVAAALVDPGVPRAAGAVPASRETATRDDDGVTLRGTGVVDDGEERIEGLDGTLTIGIEPPSREWAAPRQDVRTRTVEQRLVFPLDGGPGGGHPLHHRLEALGGVDLRVARLPDRSRLLGERHHGARSRHGTDRHDQTPHAPRLHGFSSLPPSRNHRRDDRASPGSRDRRVARM